MLDSVYGNIPEGVQYSILENMSSDLVSIFPLLSVIFRLTVCLPVVLNMTLGGVVPEKRLGVPFSNVHS